VKIRNYAAQLIELHSRFLEEQPHPKNKEQTLLAYLEWGIWQSVDCNHPKGKPHGTRQRTLQTMVETVKRVLHTYSLHVPPYEKKEHPIITTIIQRPNPTGPRPSFSQSVAKELQTKEDNMSLAVLALLARAPKTYEGLNDTAAGALSLAMEKRAIAQREELGECLVGMLARQDKRVASEELQVRQMKEVIAEKELALAQVSRAFAYANETNNYIPWACALGYSCRDLSLTEKEFAALSFVPEGWTPKASEPVEEEKDA